MSSLHLHGSCHCGAVQFSLRLAGAPRLIDCNCSMCTMTGFVHLVVDRDEFDLTAGQQALCTYTFNTHTARHLFCQTCGIKAFYVPRSHPNGYSVNVRCLDEASRGALADAPKAQFNGRDWEQSIARLRQQLDG